MRCPLKDGGLNVKLPSADALVQYENSIRITKGLVNAIVKQETFFDGMDEYGNSMKILKNEVKTKTI